MVQKWIRPIKNRRLDGIINHLDPKNGVFLFYFLIFFPSETSRLRTPELSDLGTLPEGAIIPEADCAIFIFQVASIL